MTETAWHSLSIIIPCIVTFATVLLGRIWSMFEHKKTGEQVGKIYMIMNGEVQKRIDQARQEGIQEGMKK